MGIDWESIADQVGGLDANGNELIVGTQGGRRALEVLLGEQNLRDAVDYWNAQEPGCLTAEMVLSIIESKVAMERCYEIYKTEHGSRDACSAVFLLGSFAGAEALPWVREFLDDPEQVIRLNAVRVLQRILDGRLGDQDSELAEELLTKGESDADAEVYARTRQIRAHLPPYNAHLKQS
jgi:hypothetical protein